VATIRILGIDQGTSGTRATVVDEDGRVRSHAYRGHVQHCPRPGWVEHDAVEIWRNTCAVIEEAVAKAAPSRMDALAIANPGETVLLFDRETGEPLHNALVWQDLRVQPEMERMARDEAVARRVSEITGLRLDAYFSAGKIRWLLDNVPRARPLLAQGRLAIATIDAFLIHRLTGGRSFVTDASTAARTLLFDIRTNRYDPWLLELFGVPLEALPDVCDSVGAFGTVTRFSDSIADSTAGPGADAIAGTPILVGLVDQPAAMIGHACFDDGDIKATYGTGCFVYRNTGRRPRQSKQGLLSTIAWRRDGKTTYALDGGVFAAGSVLNWLRDGLGLGDSAAALDALAASTTDTGGVVCVPALAGLAAPHWDRNTRAAWLGMTLSTSRAHLVRAAFEGIAARVAEVVRAMAVDSTQDVTRLRVDGGLAESGVLMQMQADLLGVPVEVSLEPEATVMGVCYLALTALGCWRDDGEIRERVAQQNATARVYEPKIGRAERDERLARFSRAVTLARNWGSQ
jgi:glycerol kinase